MSESDNEHQEEDLEKPIPLMPIVPSFPPGNERPMGPFSRSRPPRGRPDPEKLGELPPKPEPGSGQ